LSSLPILRDAAGAAPQDEDQYVVFQRLPAVIYLILRRADRPVSKDGLH
jgi:hypothetical protein